MPNIITHTIFAQEVAQKEKDRDIAALMERGESVVGCQHAAQGYVRFICSAICATGRWIW
ncbi:MAG: hypothetical protein ACLTCB_08490 [Merdibacter sp.]